MKYYIFLLSVVISSHAYAGAWVQPQGSGEISLNYFYYETDEFYDLQGNTQGQGQFIKHAIQPYAEYGLTDKLTVGGLFELQYVTQENVGGSAKRTNPGIADPKVFLRRHLFDYEGLTMSIEPSLKLESAFRDNRAPKGGSNVTETSIGLLSGYSFEWFDYYHFIDTRLEYRNRSGGLQEQFVADIRLGLRVSDELTIIPAFYSITNLDLPAQQTFAQNGDVDFDLYKAELGGSYDLSDELTLLAGVNAHVGGRNTGKGGGFNVGVRRKF